MPSFDDWKPQLRASRVFLADLEAFAQEFIPQHILSAHLNDYDSMYEAALLISKRMVTGLLVSNARSWRATASKSTQGRRIYEMLRREMQGPTGMIARQIVLDNARLISSIPLTVAERVTRYVAEQQAKGVRAEEIARILQRRVPHLTRARVRLIARTEVSKSETAITRARASSLGLDWYVWTTSSDQRVRKSHRNLNNVLVRFSDPPQPEELVGDRSRLGRGNAGEFPNCRCLCSPLVSLEEIGFPHRVFVNNRIQTVTRAQFQRLNVMAAAA